MFLLGSVQVFASSEIVRDRIDREVSLFENCLEGAHVPVPGLVIVRLELFLLLLESLPDLVHLREAGLLGDYF